MAPIQYCCFLWAAIGFGTLVLSSPLSCANRTRQDVGQSVDTSIVVIHGHAAPDVEGVSEYLGIPFAAPPTGALRFEPPASYNGSSTINATGFGFACIQAAAATDTPESEDCLTLNIWTKPQTDRLRKAVLVWIYGGAYTSGSSRDPTYNGKHIAVQGDVVIVSLNYRLNIFGFPGNPDTPANLGLLDLRLAMKWIRENVGAFGGDASRIIRSAFAHAMFFNLRWMEPCFLKQTEDARHDFCRP